jgi:hypothetical protein
MATLRAIDDGLDVLVVDDAFLVSVIQGIGVISVDIDVDAIRRIWAIADIGAIQNDVDADARNAHSKTANVKLKHIDVDIVENG